ncbi:MAG TPA: o-succinylbenzoate synthase [Steroidobacteraceae bacterium]|nr:o-succinylbenzoate synthase [Steroidobacteraceae bacterium]HQR48450.1 o-succinylbenzoate synthase [Steroidobacteraceae bacterium]
MRLPFARPMRTSRGTFAERVSVILELRDGEGRRGYGEAAPWPGFGTESAAAAHAALDAFSREAVGESLDAGDPSLETHACLGDAPAARAAARGALWDLEARIAGLPLAAFLAARVHEASGPVLREVHVNGLLFERSPHALRAEAARLREAGYRAAKMKLGTGSLQEEVELARAARAGLGPDVSLRGDANGAWNEVTAPIALETLADCGFEYVEQPVPPGEVAALARLRGRTPVRIAADESVAGEHAASQLLAAAAVDVMVLKPAMVGGAERALEIAARAQRAGVSVVFSHAFESAVGACHALACAAAWGDAGTAHGLETAGLFVRDLADPVAAQGGVARVARTPGLGIEL